MKFLEAIKMIVGEVRNFTKTMNPVYTGGVTMYQVKQLLKKEGINPVKIEIGDLMYKTIKFTDLIKFLRYNASRLKKYQKRKYDCENHSAVLKGQAAFFLPEVPFGEINVVRPDGGHALNFCIMMGERKTPYLLYIEPQNNNVFNRGVALKLKRFRPYWAHI